MLSRWSCKGKDNNEAVGDFETLAEYYLGIGWTANCQGFNYVNLR